MRLVQMFLLGFVFAAGITHADIFTFIVNSTAENVSLNHEQVGGNFLDGGTGANVNSFGCGGFPLPPNGCGLQFIRAEYVTTSSPHVLCSPGSPGCVPNDPTGFSPACCVIAVDDPFGNVEAYFRLIGASHSIMIVMMEYALPGEVLSPPPVDAVVTDTGGITDVVTIDWGNQDETDTIQVQFVPEPSVILLLLTACGLMLIFVHYRKTAKSPTIKKRVRLLR